MLGERVDHRKKLTSCSPSGNDRCIISQGSNFNIFSSVPAGYRGTTIPVPGPKSRCPDMLRVKLYFFAQWQPHIEIQKSLYSAEKLGASGIRAPIVSSPDFGWCRLYFLFSSHHFCVCVYSRVSQRLLKEVATSFKIRSRPPVPQKFLMLRLQDIL